ncbi:MAG: hypothetical protein CAPSK01_003365 [Candidatus Accumulibacter vicinus]|uniref:Uncharacterized protein n=1 Tax=Candidatus Accumulibacter vicinus TaxID=2954382 RepID=A0A084XXQ4_9PROT|nr:MAG: hypothetical protein CAPSK01_003365 [Candidatus Accumulibacter vicinus]
MLDVADHCTVTAAIAEVEQHEAVQCIAVTGGVDLGVDDGVAGTAEKADQAREQIVLILRIDQHLESFALWVHACLDHRLLDAGPIVQGARVPGDFFRGMAQEIHRVELLPQALVYRVGKREVA